MTEPSALPAAVAAVTADERAERRRSIGKYVKRLGNVLRRGSSKGDVPTSSSAAVKPEAKATATASASAPDTTVEEEEEEEQQQPQQQKPVIEEYADTDPLCPKQRNLSANLHFAFRERPVAVTTSAGGVASPGAYARSAIQQERARALFAKYGLTLEAHEWIPTGTAATVQRVEKPIRMRVHRNCHRCGTTYGADRICVKCEHKRCKKCPRYPPKKPKDKGPVGVSKDPKGKGTGAESKGGEEMPRKKRKPLLTIQSRAGTDLVYRQKGQRIRRRCHKCDTLFNPPTSTVCESCQHLRCTRCPRDPAKEKKWPHGYPGDADYASSEDEQIELRPRKVYRKPRQRVRWTCSECSTMMKDGKVCSNCDHQRCENCIREP
jgi:hypothetical protein